MKEYKPKFYKTITIKFTESDFGQFYQNFSSTMHRTLSEYARNLLCGKPVNVKYHDRTFDNYIESCVGIKKTLNNILNSDKITDAEKQEMQEGIIVIKEIMLKVESYARQNKIHEKHS